MIQSSSPAAVLLLRFGDGCRDLAEHGRISLRTVGSLPHELFVAIHHFNQPPDVEEPLPGIGERHDRFRLFAQRDIE